MQRNSLLANAISKIIRGGGGHGGHNGDYHHGAHKLTAKPLHYQDDHIKPYKANYFTDKKMIHNYVIATVAIIIGPGYIWRAGNTFPTEGSGKRSTTKIWL